MLQFITWFFLPCFNWIIMCLRISGWTETARTWIYSINMIEFIEVQWLSNWWGNITGYFIKLVSIFLDDQIKELIHGILISIQKKTLSRRWPAKATPLYCSSIVYRKMTIWQLERSQFDKNNLKNNMVIWYSTLKFDRRSSMNTWIIQKRTKEDLPQNVFKVEAKFITQNIISFFTALEISAYYVW